MNTPLVVWPDFWLHLSSCLRGHDVLLKGCIRGVSGVCWFCYFLSMFPIQDVDDQVMGIHNMSDMYREQTVQHRGVMLIGH
jgi:hypothetical protein